MPVLDIDGHVICQSLAICRYLSNEFGFYGDSNLDKLDIDQIVDTLVDHFAEICKIVFDKSLSDDEKVSVRKKLLSIIFLVSKIKCLMEGIGLVGEQSTNLIMYLIVVGYGIKTVFVCHIRKLGMTSCSLVSHI